MDSQSNNTNREAAKAASTARPPMSPTVYLSQLFTSRSPTTVMNSSGTGSSFMDFPRKVFSSSTTSNDNVAPATTATTSTMARSTGSKNDAALFADAASNTTTPTASPATQQQQTFPSTTTTTWSRRFASMTDVHGLASTADPGRYAVTPPPKLPGAHSAFSRSAVAHNGAITDDKPPLLINAGRFSESNNNNNKNQNNHNATMTNQNTAGMGDSVKFPSAPSGGGGSSSSVAAVGGGTSSVDRMVCMPHRQNYRGCLEVNLDQKSNCTWALDDYMRCRESFIN